MTVRAQTGRWQGMIPALLAAMLVACGGGGGGGTTAPPVSNTPPPRTLTKAELDDASRFAGQATFGLTYAELEALARSDQNTWLNTQFSLPVTLHSPTVVDIVTRRAAGEFDAFEEDIEYLIFARRLAWWHNTVTAEDTLRQRVAFALSQIFVVSDNVDSLLVYPAALSTYYDVLLRNAFGNYRDLLYEVATSPAMGVYLSHLNNRRSDPANNIFPDENFAREVMQLFSIGLFELNQDGTVVRDGIGDPVPTYDNSDIAEFAKIFTGFSFGGTAAFFGNENDPRFSVPMQMFDAAHEPGEKVLLNGTVVPAGQSGLQDVQAAVDNLFNHPNVGPFIGKQLIQRLVTSNPSPAYVSRVSAIFADNGSGVRGDLQAVIRAILTDSEATTRPPVSANNGKLREPVVRYVSLLRQFEATSEDGFIAALGYFLQQVTRQHPLSAPSVFNFYLPGHAPAGDIASAGLVAPEFQITDANSIVGWPNLIDAILFADLVTDAPEGFAPVSLQFDEWLALASDATALVDRLDTLLTGGELSPELRQITIDSVDILQSNELRVQAAIYLFLISPDYLVQR
ncbi:MAG: DUF1800 domain-containing protein [Pseudomonadota bacterium]